MLNIIHIFWDVTTDFYNDGKLALWVESPNLHPVGGNDYPYQPDKATLISLCDTWFSNHTESFGKKAQVLHLHHNLPYAFCRINISSTTKIENYYPLQMIKDQLEEKEKEEAMTIEDIINQMKHLISKL